MPEHPETLPDWANLSILHRNTLPARSSFFVYSSAADAISRDVGKAKALCLSGTWRFHLSQSPFEAPNFESAGFDSSKWSKIQVPGMWQLQGFSRPQYTNVNFPFFVDPPHVPYHDNECGSYITVFRVPDGLQDHQLRLRFEGVDSGFHVWVNGQSVGYSQGARNPSEFDITGHVKPDQENVLAVRVYQYTDGSYIEDQDQWRASGIFRDVYLLGFPPKNRIDNLSKIETDLDEHYRDATLKVQILAQGSGAIKLRLIDAEDKEVLSTSKIINSEAARTIDFFLGLPNPEKWTAETPYLYNLVISLNDEQFITHKVGFRKIELKGGLIQVNGRRIVFRGANRHEHHPKFGRSVPYDFMRQDLILMKTHNFNAIRSCHQPSDTRLYDLADELGFWVMDEADLECHGFESIEDAALSSENRSLPFFERQKLTRANAATWTSDNLDWKEAYLDRAEQLVKRDILHPSVIVWSLGNEAFFGRNHVAMRDWIKSHDPTRLVHYEPDLKAEYMDMYSRMYPHIDEIIRFGESKANKKPLVLCEFAHAMGSGPGNIKEYVDAFYQYPSLQGGFVWEWANHGLLTKTKGGRPFYGYGGDFGDIPNDSNFVMDGVLNSDHTPRSALIEFKKAFEPVQVISLSADKIKIANRLDFATLDQFCCIWSLVDETGSGKAKGELSIPSGVLPGATAEIKLPDPKADTSKESFINLSFALSEDTSWAKSGHEVALIQIPVASISTVDLPTVQPASKLVVDASATTLTIHTVKTHWEVDLIRGRIHSWKQDGHDLLSRSLEPNLYRAPTDNDKEDWKEKLLHLAKVHTRHASWKINDDGTISVSFNQKIAPPVLSWSIEITSDYLFSPAGTAKVNFKGTPAGQNLPATFPRIGVTLGMPHEYQHVKWFGRGPGECYVDMKLSQAVDIHSVSKIDDLWTAPEFPQECSNRTDTRWLVISSPKANLTVQFLKSNDSDKRYLFDFMASHYNVGDIEEARHPCELEEKKQDDIILRLDARHHGLGTGSCGPKTLEQYALKMEPFELTILLHGQS